MSKQSAQQARFTLRIPQTLQDKAKERADTQHISLNNFIVRAVERALLKKGTQQ